MKKFLKILRLVSIILIITVSTAGIVYFIAVPDAVGAFLGTIGLSWSFPLYWTVFLISIALVVAAQQLLDHLNAKEQSNGNNG